MRMTKGREQVLTVLKKTAYPLSADDIKKLVTLDPVTIYRILDVFVTERIAVRVELGEGKYRYEIAGRHHHHVVCTHCKAVTDVDHVSETDLDIAAAKKTGYTISTHSLEFFGLCPKCQ